MPITREAIIERLSEKYPSLNFVPTTITKNGDVHLDAICVRNDSNIAPTIYIDNIIDHSDSLDEAVEFISNIIEQHSNPNIDTSKLTNKDFILNRIRIGIQKESDEILVKKPVPDFSGIEQYLYFVETPKSGGHDSWSVKIKSELLKAAGIEESEAWNIAEQHTFAATTIQSMTEVLTEMMGDNFDKDFAELAPVEMYIISNRERTKGAASIINHELLKHFAIEHNTKAVAVLPSSIHECILIPLGNSMDISNFDEMVREVNATQVTPEEILVDRSFLITFE